MSNKSFDTISAINYQLPISTESTWSECSIKKCENGARGGGVCLSCIVKFSEHPEITASLVDAAKAKHAASIKLIEACQS